MFKILVKRDKGDVKLINEDSLLVRHLVVNQKHIVMAIICDGMGGLSKGEVASGTVVNDFNNWFNQCFLLENFIEDMTVVVENWTKLLIQANTKLKKYGQDKNIKLGTTFTGMIFIQDKGLLVHIGDSKCYRMTNHLKQLSEDHTIVNEEVKRGLLTQQQAKTDSRKHILTRCVGVLDHLDLQIKFLNVTECTYMLCSDGFSNRTLEQEMLFLQDEQAIVHQIKTVRQRGEKDNISIIYIKVGKND